MATYDFRSLSPLDFELLCRDLLQAHLNIYLESFSAGPDSGIDFRHKRPDGAVIVQCKHYVDSGFGALRSALRNRELPKIKTLSPKQYILMTSVGLTPTRKTKIQEWLGLDCLSSQDIYGADDLNNLLGLYPDVERKHFKLWLTSSAVLHRLLNAGIFSDSENHIEQIRARLSRYVPNASLGRARCVLDDNHYCIIAGHPGIGKTTLAEVLLAELVDKHGFSAIRIDHDISEIRRVRDPRLKQVFYFDDFLGRTSVMDLRRNEDKRLVELMRETKENSKWRFLLTTREYILNAAKQHYEALAHPIVPIQPCIVSMSDYRRPIRAKILYNHLFFSQLSKNHKLQLLRDDRYKRILGHKNYSPRVIQYMTEPHFLSETPAQKYADAFVASLDDPRAIWQHAYEHQISRAAQHVLLVLTTLPFDTHLEDVQAAFWRFYSDRRTSFGFPTDPTDWTNALKELDGNFIATAKIEDANTVSFHNPTVQDFMEHHLGRCTDDVVALVRSAVFLDQLRSLWWGIKRKRYRIPSSRGEEFVQLMAEGAKLPDVRFKHLMAYHGGTRSEVRQVPTSDERRVEFLVDVVEDERSSRGEEVIATALAPLPRRWNQGISDRSGLLALIKRLVRRGLRHDDGLFLAAKGCVLSEGDWVDDYTVALAFCDSFSDVVDQDDLEELAHCFLGFLEGRIMEDMEDDPEELRRVAAEIETVGERLGVEEATGVAAELEDRASELEGDEDDYSYGGRMDWKSDSDDQDERSLFAGLRDQLEDGP